MSDPLPTFETDRLLMVLVQMEDVNGLESSNYTN